MHRQERNVSLIAFAISVLISIILYGNTLRGKFVFDDEAFVRSYNIFSIVDQRKIWLETPQPKSKKQGIYRPIASLTFAFNSTFFGLRPESYHAINILLNALAGWILFLLVKILFGNLRLAGITAVIFLFLPIHTEAVAYIKARDELLATVLALSGLVVLLQKPVLPVRFKKYGTASVLFGLAALSKDFGFMIPLVGLLIFSRRENIPRKAWLKLTGYVLLFPIMAFALRMLVLGSRAFGTDINYFVINPLGYTDVVTRILTAGQLAFLYITKTFVPYGLSATYHFNQIPLIRTIVDSWQVPAGFFLLGVLVCLALVPKTAGGAFGIGAVLFLLPYLVFSKFLFKWGDMFAERWMYLPSVGLALIAGQFIDFGFKKQKLVTTVVVCTILLVYSGIIIPRNRVWNSKKALAESMLASAPNSVMTYMHLSEYYAETERNYTAAKQYADIGMRIYPTHPPLLELSAGIEYQLGNVSRARILVDQALFEQPELVGARILDATLLAKAGKYQDSINTIQTHIPLRIKDPLVRYIMAVNWYKLGEYHQAKQYFDWDNFLSDEQKTIMLERF